jgi:hypothetical protein
MIVPEVTPSCDSKVANHPCFKSADIQWHTLILWPHPYCFSCLMMVMITMDKYQCVTLCNLFQLPLNKTASGHNGQHDMECKCSSWARVNRNRKLPNHTKQHPKLISLIIVQQCFDHNRFYINKFHDAVFLEKLTSHLAGQKISCFYGTVFMKVP